MHRHSHHLHPHLLHWGGADRQHRHSGSSGSYVGRTGVLAVALGIGTAALTGSCMACATAGADTGDRGSSSNGASTSTSQSVEAPRRGPRANTSSVSPGQHQKAGAPRSSATSDRLTAPTKIHLPDAATAPVVLSALADLEIAAEVPFTASAPAQHAGASQAPIALSVAPKVFQPADVPLPPAVVVASPAAASSRIATTFTNVLTSLSSALNGGTPTGTPTVPQDAALSLMLGAARRESVVTPRSAATRFSTVATADSSATTATVEGERMSISRAGAARVVYDSKASGRSAMAVVGTGSVSATVTIPTSTALIIRARKSSGAPSMTVAIDGVPITTVVVNSASYADYTFAGTIPEGTHVISISSSNATSGSALYLDKVSTSAGAIGDHFTGKVGSGANRTIWTTTTGTGWDTGIETYVGSGAYLDGQGHLVLQSTKTSSGGYTSGRVQTANKMSFGYGTITARIKVPQGQALWPAFWLVGADEASTSWPAVGEIDVMELPSTTTTVYSTLHGPIAGTTATQQAQIISTLPDLSTGYHDYWVRHLEDEITFGVDSQTLGTLTPADLAPGETWVYNRPMSVVINLAVGGPWAGAPDSRTPTKAQMLVDSLTYAPA